MARPHGSQRMDHPRPDAHRGRRDDDQRLAHHHPGTHLDDRHPKTIRHTFMWFAVFIIGKGMLIGNVLSLGLLALQQAFGIIKLDAQTYYVSTVPVEINALYIVALNVATLLISVFMLVAPSYLISHIHPAKSMRYE